MSSIKKIFIIILSFLAAIFLMIYVFLALIDKNTPKEVKYPKGNLSDSIFASQNMEYKPDEKFPGTYEFLLCPYTVNVPDKDFAALPGNGKIYLLSDDLYLYLTEYPSDKKIEDILKDELSFAALIDADKDRTQINNLLYEEGFLNGFKVNYGIYKLNVTNSKDLKEVDILGYDLYVTDNSNYHGNNLYIGIFSDKIDTKTLLKQKSILDSVFYTFKFSEDIDKRIKEDEDNKLKLLNEENIKEDDNDNVKTITIDEELKNVNLIFSYEGNITSVYLKSPLGAIYNPASNDGKDAIFNIPVMEKGIWEINIRGDVKNESVRIIKGDK